MNATLDQVFEPSHRGTDRRRWLRFGLRTLIMVTVTCGVGLGIGIHYLLRDINLNPRLDQVTIELAVHSNADQRMCKLTNHSDGTFFYYGYEQGSPLYGSMEKTLNGKWVGVQSGWCGTGAQDVRLGPGESHLVRIYEKSKKAPYKILITLSAITSPDVWPFDREHIQLGHVSSKAISPITP